MKKKLTWFLLSILCAAFIYLLFAFGNWELNPGLWLTETRSICAIVICFVVAITNIFPTINN